MNMQELQQIIVKGCTGAFLATVDLLGLTFHKFEFDRVLMSLFNESS